MRLEQDAGDGRRERNDRVVGVPENAPRSEISSAEDLPRRMRDEIERFFLDVTFFEDKRITLLGWDRPAAALRAVERAAARAASKRSARKKR